MEYSNVSVDQWNEFDKERVEDGGDRVREDRKVVRKVKWRAICKKQDGFKHLEGVQYQSASFHYKPQPISSKGRGRGHGRGRGKI